MRKAWQWGFCVLVLGLISGCGNNDEPDIPAPHTGHPVFEEEVAPLPEGEKVAPKRFRGMTTSKIYFVYTNRLNVRSAPEINDDNLVGALELNDQVRVLAEVADTVFVQIEVVKSNTQLQQADAYYVSRDYLSEKRNNDSERTQRSRYFMIQNVATEKLRVYEKMCDDGRCAHKMIFEAEIAVGEKTRDKETMTVLGYFHVSRWAKFYQDGGKRYPSWYDPNYPALPPPGAGPLDWTRKKVLPDTKEAKVRGAFGWYTALVAPNNYAQWTHGTLGWGADKDKYIASTRGFWTNLFMDPRSHGCSRTDNETIAFVRQLIDTGAPILKVYAVENLADPERLRYPEKTSSWNYILTKNGVRVDGEKADREEVLARATPESQWLEQGTYKVDVYPNVEEFKSGRRGAKAGRNGNVYGLKDEEMRGVFLIDEGRLVNYFHPASLTVGGYGRESFPGFVRVIENKMP